MAEMFVAKWAIGPRATWGLIFATLMIWFVVRSIQSIQLCGLQNRTKRFTRHRTKYRDHCFRSNFLKDVAAPADSLSQTPDTWRTEALSLSSETRDATRST
jgi:hypothetical protein